MNHQYRKKPVVIEAFRMTREARQDNTNWPEWLNYAWQKPQTVSGAVFPSQRPFTSGNDELNIKTLEGVMLVKFGSWIIKGINDELYACDHEIFEKTYEKV